MRRRRTSHEMGDKRVQIKITAQARHEDVSVKGVHLDMYSQPLFAETAHYHYSWLRYYSYRHLEQMDVRSDCLVPSKTKFGREVQTGLRET